MNALGCGSLPSIKFAAIPAKPSFFLPLNREATLSTKPWFKCYPSDFLRGVAHLVPNELALYTISLMEMYDTDGPIPDKIEWLARRCNMRPTTCEKALAGLLEAGKLIRENGQLINNRAENLMKSRRKVGEKSKENISKRWNKSEEKPNKINGSDSNPYSKTDTEPILTRSQKLELESTADAVGTFDKLWKAWTPNKTPKGDKVKAFEQWGKQVIKAGVDPDMVITHAHAYCAECVLNDTNTANVFRWIRDHRWNDERLPIKQSGSSEDRTAARRREMLKGLEDAGRLDTGLRSAEGHNP